MEGQFQLELCKRPKRGKQRTYKTYTQALRTSHFLHARTPVEVLSRANLIFLKHREVQPVLTAFHVVWFERRHSVFVSL